MCVCVRVCTIETRRVTRREQRHKEGSDDEGIAQRAGIKESVGIIRPVWPLQCWGVGGCWR
jgi:hypothetical protein